MLNLPASFIAYEISVHGRADPPCLESTDYGLCKATMARAAPLNFQLSRKEAKTLLFIRCLAVDPQRKQLVCIT
ncbi:hypothetical protein CEXT_671671 [Caerostris extrusa]|uniref:Uncharacterized protein n=1 Tax=Caerostris extrusa TaxID=172846 RepID=A0AAV4X8F8_CAEEX|nr:hypothetical protein CEXT_671671 [Caerostris extrusa]